MAEVKFCPGCGKPLPPNEILGAPVPFQVMCDLIIGKICGCDPSVLDKLKKVEEEEDEALD